MGWISSQISIVWGEDTIYHIYTGNQTVYLLYERDGTRFQPASQKRKSYWFDDNFFTIFIQNIRVLPRSSVIYKSISSFFTEYACRFVGYKYSISMIIGSRDIGGNNFCSFTTLNQKILVWNRIITSYSITVMEYGL